MINIELVVTCLSSNGREYNMVIGMLIYDSQSIEELLSGKRVIINELIEKVEELNSISSLRDSDNTKEIIYNIGMWKN